MSSGPRVRFAFRVVDGPGAGLCCGGWRLWTRAEDTYLTAVSLGDTWKVSLHGDVWWACSVTAENARRPDTVLPAGHDRAMWRFTPTPFVDGRRLAFAVGVFRHALRPGPPDPRETVVVVPDRWDVLTLALIRMTEPGVGPDPGWHVLGGPLPLASGRRVWLTVSHDDVPPAEPEPVPDGVMVEPVGPGTHDVASPGCFVKGLHVA